MSTRSYHEWYLPLALAKFLKSCSGKDIYRATLEGTVFVEHIPAEGESPGLTRLVATDTHCLLMCDIIQKEAVSVGIDTPGLFRWYDIRAKFPQLLLPADGKFPDYRKVVDRQVRTPAHIEVIWRKLGSGPSGGRKLEMSTAGRWSFNVAYLPAYGDEWSGVLYAVGDNSHMADFHCARMIEALPTSGPAVGFSMRYVMMGMMEELKIFPELEALPEGGSEP